MQRIAVPMIGGMISSTILTLAVIPAVYAWIKGFGLPREPTAAVRVERRVEVQSAANAFDHPQAAE
jgi:Cu(I)/Ag(I) efflux system membrane protein CusA/SilA